MCIIWLHSQELLSALIIKIKHDIWLAMPCFGRCHILYFVSLPQSTCIPECANAALCADAGTCQNHYLTHLLLLFRQFPFPRLATLQMHLRYIRRSEEHTSELQS